MANDKKNLIFLVDDDELFLKNLELEFIENTKSEIRSFGTGEECLAKISMNPDVVILDYYLNSVKEDAIDGLETLDRIKSANIQIPVIMLSSQDKIDVAVNCMKHQAFDYIVKSETVFLRLQRAITTIFHFQRIEKALSWYMEKM